MSITTTAPTIPDVDLEAWLAGEIEKTCEMYRTYRSTSLCGRLAEFVVSGHCGKCRATRAKFCCADCHRFAVRVGIYEHDGCGGVVRTSWIERIKGGAS